MSIDEIVQIIHKMNCKYIVITGGEPLLHGNLIHLLERFNSDYKFCIETNGTKKIPYLLIETTPFYMPYIYWVVDYKIQYKRKMRCDYTILNKKDFIKFVIDTESSIDEAIKIQKKLMKKFTDQNDLPTFAYSVVRNSTSKIDKQLYKSILDKLEKNNMDAVLNFQIHKEINVL
jgi:organic radical activating enzyme